MNGGDGSQQAFFINEGGRIFASRQADDTIRVQYEKAAGGINVQFNSTNTFTTSVNTGWHNLLFATNFSTSTFDIYLDDAVLAGSFGTSPNSGDTDWTVTNWAIGANTSGAIKLDGDLAEFYITAAETLDISMQSNRRKFISSNGKPVDLESDGSGPTGTAPLIYFSGATATWHTNDSAGSPSPPPAPGVANLVNPTLFPTNCGIKRELPYQ